MVDIRICPEPDGENTNECGNEDSALLAEGWERRSVVDSGRAAESIELYESLGFEVQSRLMSPADFDPRCRACAEESCGEFIVLYTRKKEAPRGSNPLSA